MRISVRNLILQRCNNVCAIKRHEVAGTLGRHFYDVVTSQTSLFKSLNTLLQHCCDVFYNVDLKHHLHATITKNIELKLEKILVKMKVAGEEKKKLPKKLQFKPPE